VGCFIFEINHAITTLAGQDIVDRCEAGSTSLCQYVARNGSGAITSVTQAYINLASIKERGLDLETDYTLPFDRVFETASGELNFRFLATYVAELRTSDGINTADLAGAVGNVIGTDIGGLPHWRWNAQATYSNGGITAFVRERYIGGGKYTIGYTSADINNNTVGSQCWAKHELRRRRGHLANALPFAAIRSV